DLLCPGHRPWSAGRKQALHVDAQVQACVPERTVDQAFGCHSSPLRASWRVARCKRPHAGHIRRSSSIPLKICLRLSHIDGAKQFTVRIAYAHQPASEIVRAWLQIGKNVNRGANRLLARCIEALHRTRPHLTAAFTVTILEDVDLVRS